MTYEDLLEEIKNNAKILSEEGWFSENNKEKIEKAMRVVMRDYVREYSVPYHYDFSEVVKKYLEYNLEDVQNRKNILECVELNREKYKEDFGVYYPHFEEEKIYNVLYNWMVGNVLEKRYSLKERLEEYLKEDVI